MNIWPFKKKLEPVHPRLGRRVQFDERSRLYPVRALIQATKPRSYTWSCKVWLNQGETPTCVGNSWAHELIARPIVEPNITEDTALNIYKTAQTLDDWPGENYNGTSVLAGAKALQQLGYIQSYHWGFGLDDVVMTVGHKGPVVIGINWYENMFQPDSKGLLNVGGKVAGGHAILVNGVNVKNKLFRLHNSWGKSWGIKGEAFLTFDDMDRLLKDNGEAVLAIGEKLIK